MPIESQLGDLAHLSAGWSPWIVTCRWKGTSNITPKSSGTQGLTIADLDLDAGIALGDVLDTPNDLRHACGVIANVTLNLTSPPAASRNLGASKQQRWTDGVTSYPRCR